MTEVTAAAHCHPGLACRKEVCARVAQRPRERTAGGTTLQHRHPPPAEEESPDGDATAGGGRKLERLVAQRIRTAGGATPLNIVTRARITQGNPSQTGNQGFAIWRTDTALAGKNHPAPDWEGLQDAQLVLEVDAAAARAAARA